MPLRDDILTPISGANPSGENLKYAPVYDKIKEARREDDDAPQGDWRRERKLADWNTVLKLAGDALATKSKDLQLAAWITEALLKKEGFPGLLSGLRLVQGLLENFWDTVYPEVEDGDVELRAAPVEWIGLRLEIPIRQAPVTKSGLSFLSYKDTRTVPTEADAVESSERAEERAAAIAEGKLTPEDWEKAFQGSAKDYYKNLVAAQDSILETVEALTLYCEEKFGEYAPAFGKLRDGVEEVRHFTNGLLQKKLEIDPDEAPAEADDSGWSTTAEEYPAGEASDAGSYAAAAPARAPERRIPAGEPADRKDALDRVVAAAGWLRREDPYNPAPFLLLRAVRWGELRAAGSSLDPNLFEPPSTKVRQTLKKLSNEADWPALLEAAENAMGEPCGRAWLDLQRHVIRACEEMGSYYDAIASAVKADLRGLLADYPDLADSVLLDDTPTANPETRAWLKTIASPAASAAAAPVMEPEEFRSESSAAAPDSFELAMDAARGGRPQEGIELITAEIGRAHSGRARFQRKMQLAQLCIAIGHDPIARSILEELARTIERHQLEEWESAEVVAHALSMLYSCLSKLDGDPAEMQKLYSRICRLDPMQALAQAR